MLNNTSMNTETDPRGGKTSASNALPDSLCQWRFTMQRGIAAPPESPDAGYGRKIHNALAAESPEGLTVQERDIYESCLEILNRKLVEFFGQDQSGITHFNHRRFWAKFSASLPERGFLEHSGEADRVYRKVNRLLIPDFKTLAGDTPDSPKNLQLRDLACLATKELIADDCGVLIIQPLVTHNPDIVLYTKADLVRAREEMYRRVEASNFPIGEPVPGEEQCKFCLAKEKCLPYTRWAGTSVPAMITLLDVPLSDWTPEQRKMFCDRRPVAQKWLNDTLAFMEAGAAKDPGFVPGYALKPGNVVEKIVNPQAVFERFLAIGGTQERFIGTVTVGKGKLEAQVAEVAQLKGKRLKDKMAALLDGATESKQNAPTLKKA